MYRYRKTDEFAMAVIIPPQSSPAIWSPLILSEEQESIRGVPETATKKKKTVLRLNPASESHTQLHA